ncbi:MAG: M1 family metallopeptidase [Bacteroidales bacterium]|nr:M1 family metallopeptidase [Bacteroidales bacterium]MBN2757966.1 M1 family metallopeptidase [Bacteroidales bacterium]
MKKSKSIFRNYILISPFLFILLNINNLSAQNDKLFIPIEYQNAIKNGTRTETGEPGKNYWQNKINYTIVADFNPETGILKGKETINFTNKSPDYIYTIVFNLYPDLYKKGGKRDSEVQATDLHDGTKIKSILVNDKIYYSHSSKWNYSDTHFYLNLSSGLKPDETVKIDIEWEFSMSKTTRIRNGKYSENTWFVSYWYPQIAVYDDIYGWDEINYDGLHEFYSPFADFDVKINVPAKQIIWATGELQNSKDIFIDKYFNKLETAKKSDKTIHIIDKNDLSEKITKNNENISWNFKADNVVDFAFSTSNHYLWDATSLIVDKKTGRRANIYAAYDKNSSDFYNVADIAKKTIKYLSDSLPGIPYPYPNMTVFNGHGGMEYPMIVNDGSELSKSRTVFLTSHEITHTFFPFYMGINQERFAWIDEGLTMFIPSQFQTNTTGKNQSQHSTQTYNSYAGKSLDLPLMTASFNIKNYEYYVLSYYKPEMAYRILEDIIGKELFIKSLQTLILRWNGKYTSPYDIFFTFNDVAGEDLSWFWKPWFFEFGYPDLELKNITQKDNIFEISVIKNGNLPIPVYLTVLYNDQTTEVFKETAKVWKNSNQYTYKLKSNKKIKSVTIGNKTIPDINTENNTFYLK